MAAGGRCVKLLFDETIGAPIARALIDVARHHTEYTVDAVVMGDFEGCGSKDDHWAVRAQLEGRFVITGDRGRGDGPPLDILLPYLGVSAAFMTGTLQSKRPQFEKARSVLFLWPAIVAAASASTPGTRYRMRCLGDGYHFAEWPLNDKARRRQVELLGKFPENLWEARFVK